MAGVFIPSLLCVGGVLLGTVGFAGARILNLAGLVAGVGAAMLPLFTHHDPRMPRTRRPEPAGPAAGDVQIEERVVQ